MTNNYTGNIMGYYEQVFDVCLVYSPEQVTRLAIRVTRRPGLRESDLVMDDLDEMTADDFILGLFAALTRRHRPTVSMREANFYEAVQASFRKLEELAAKEPDVVDVAFRVKLDPLYGDSAVVRNAINAVVQRTFLSLDNPEFVTLRSKLDETEAMEAISHLPGRPDWYQKMADAFLEVESAKQPA